MSEQTKLVGGVGVVLVGDLEVTITPLSMAEETILDRRLRVAAQASANDPYTAASRALKAAEKNPGDRIEMLREIARIASSKTFLSGGAFYDYRISAAGVAVELFARGKKATPGLTLKGLQAIITEANCEEIHVAMMEVIDGKGEGVDGDEKKAGATP